MKVLVSAKKVIDFNIKIRIKTDGSGVETEHVKTSMNPFDEIAVEEAVRLKEKGLASEIIVVSIGGQSSQEILRTALALGADRAILVLHDQPIEPLNVAKILKQLVIREQPQLVILGKQAIDDDCNQTGQMLAALLEWPQGTFASQLNFEGQYLDVVREVDQGMETIRLTLPAVITTDLRLNQPRYATLPNIMRAKQKPLTTIAISELITDLKPHSQILKVAPPHEKKSGIKMQNFKELMDKLKEKNYLSER